MEVCNLKICKFLINMTNFSDIKEYSKTSDQNVVIAYLETVFQI